MSQHRRLLYVVADGAMARFIERRRDGAFVTIREIDGRAQLALVREQQRDEPAGRSIESATTARHAVGREDGYHRAKAAFARQTAEAVRQTLAGEAWSGVVLVSPPRLLRVLRDELATETNVAGTLGKDLNKTPDHALGRWLDHVQDVSAA